MSSGDSDRDSARAALAPREPAEIEAELAALDDDSRDDRARAELLCELAWELGLVDTVRSKALTARAEALAEQLEQPEALEAACERNRGYYAYLASDYPQAMRHGRKALALYQALGDAGGEAAALQTLGIVYMHIGRYDDALVSARRCLDLHRARGDRRGEGWALAHLGKVYADTGDAELAVARQREAIEAFNSVDYAIGVALPLNELAALAERRGDFDEALAHLLECAELAERFGAALPRIKTCQNLAHLHGRMGNAVEARRCLEQALALAHENQHSEGVATALLALGELHREAGDLEAAEAAVKRALGATQQLDAKPLTARVHRALSQVHAAAGRHEVALEHFEAFHELHDEVFGEAASARLKRLQVQLEVDRLDQEAEIHRLRYVELAEAQQRLVRSEKMALLGDLVAGIAHEINSPLGALESGIDLSARAASMLADEATSAARRRRAAEALEAARHSARDACARIASVINNLQSFSRLDEPERQRADVSEGLASALALLAPQLPDALAVEQDIAAMPPIDCYPGELNQVFMTLLKNAVEAMATGPGTLRVAARLTGDDAERAIEVTIADTGRGMSAEQIEALFDIGFSRRDTRVRLRVGLANALAIVRKHGGEIDVASEPGHGTCFTIALPLSSERPRGDDGSRHSP